MIGVVLSEEQREAYVDAIAAGREGEWVERFATEVRDRALADAMQPCVHSMHQDGCVYCWHHKALAEQREALARNVETAFQANLSEQAERGPSVDFDWLLGAVLVVARGGSDDD